MPRVLAAHKVQNEEQKENTTMLLLAEPCPAPTPFPLDAPQPEPPERWPGSLFAARDYRVAARLAGVVRPVVSGVQLTL